MGEKNIGHFFKQTILYNILAMNGLVSGYGSDSDDEEVTSDIKKSKDEDWMECMDNTTGYPYFWNRKTNEVRWDLVYELTDDMKFVKKYYLMDEAEVAAKMAAVAA